MCCAVHYFGGFALRQMPPIRGTWATACLRGSPPSVDRPGHLRRTASADGAGQGWPAVASVKGVCQEWTRPGSQQPQPVKNAAARRSILEAAKQPFAMSLFHCFAFIRLFRVFFLFFPGGLANLVLLVLLVSNDRPPGHLQSSQNPFHPDLPPPPPVRGDHQSLDLGGYPTPTFC